jgi:hypothetical protein
MTTVRLPTKAKCQKFHTSMFRVRVRPNTSRTILTIKASGIINVPTLEPKAIAAAVGQPTSTAVSCTPVFVTIASEIPAKAPHMRPITRLMPTKAIPMVMPARNARPGLMPNNNPRTKMIIGSSTVGPIAPRMSCKDLKKVAMI